MQQAIANDVRGGQNETIPEIDTGARSRLAALVDRHRVVEQRVVGVFGFGASPSQNDPECDDGNPKKKHLDGSI
jgi:hypothetical protein